jgi:short-subunit dehydrogenase involved in D-alanine esterification of teichoic acids
VTVERDRWPVVNVAKLGIDMVTVTLRRERRGHGVDIVETAELVVHQDEAPRIGDHAYLDVGYWIKERPQ